MATLNLTLDTRRARKGGTYPLVFIIRVEEKFCNIEHYYLIMLKEYCKISNL
jgi:hypothetical protein